MESQREHWDGLHAKGALDHFADDPTPFCYEVAALLPPHQKILELGCGAGNDSNYFAMLGHQVLATDFSEVAIEKNREFYKNDNLTFEVLDISNALPFKNNSYDLVYARLSLHYFTDEKTREIVGEIARILKPGGLLAFVCKSTSDPKYGVGKMIEKDMYENGGHVRHFFSKNYTEKLLQDEFETLKLEEGEEEFYSDISAFIKVIARKM